SPPTTAAAEEPRPREWGMMLRHFTIRPCARSPEAARPRSTARTTRWSGLSGTCPEPSPSTSTTSPDSVVSTTISSYNPTARPRLSNPGPRLALDAGTVAPAVRPAGRTRVMGSAQTQLRDDGDRVDGHRRHRRHAGEGRVGILETVAG